MTLEEAAATITRALPVLPQDSLRFFGEWFGMRRDNIHTITAATVGDAALTLRFDEGETLSVWNPSGLVTTEAIFRIDDASRVRWEWFYYGRPPIPADLMRIEYWRTPDGRIDVEDTFEDTYSTGVVHDPDASAPAVEILALDP